MTAKIEYVVCQESLHGWRVAFRTDTKKFAEEFILAWNDPEEPRYWIEEEVSEWD